MHTSFLRNRLGRWLAVLLLLVGATAARAQTLINENFEGGNSFTLVNGAATNAWVVGAAAGNGPTTTGAKAAYISNDGGTTHAYTTTAISVVHMYQDVTFPAGQTIIQLGLDWRGLGESSTTYDDLQLFLVPTTVTPAASNSGALSANSRLQNSGYTPFATLTGQTAYSRSTITIPASAAGTTQRLVMQWYNDASGGTNPPAAVDNVVLTAAAAVPLCGTKSVGPTGDYASLTAAFAAVNLNGVCGPLVLELQSSYVSTGETFPLTYTYAGGSATNTVTVRPAAGATGLSISGSSTSSILSLSGGKYFVLDGRPGGSGSTVSGAATATDLLVANTNTSGIVLNLTNDATNSAVQHCQLKGVGTSSSYPVVNFNSTATAGNSNNTVQNNALGSGASPAAVLVYSGSSLNATNTVLNNTLADFYNASNTSYGVYLSSAGNNWTISGNSFYQTASRTAVALTNYGIYVVSGGGHTIANNAIGGAAAATISTTGPATLSGTWTVGAAAFAYRFVGIYVSGSTTACTVQNNTIGNMSWYSSSGATTAPGVWGGIYLLSNANVQGNTVGNGVTVTSTTSGGISYGIVSSTGPTTLNINGNTVAGLTGAGSATTIAHSVAGIQTQATTNNVYQNKVYGLVAGNAGVSTGILALAGTTTTIYNNLIGNLTAPASTSLTAVAGLSVGGGTTMNAYYNSIYLSASSTGATFGTSGIYLNSTTATLDARNNIVVNKSTAAGTGGYTAALRRVSGTAATAPANLATTTNNNLYYAGTPSATNLIYVEGTTTATNAQQTLAAYKAFVAPRESSSVTEDAPFLSTTGTDATFLHINPAVATQVESGGAPVSGITTDYDGDARNATTPDIGADEGSFLVNDQTPPSITYTALGNTSSTGSRTLTVTIIDPSGVATGTGAPLLYYRVGTSGAYTSVAATSVSGSTYTFTLPGAAAGSTVQYYVAAQDASPSNNAGTSPVGGSGSNPPGSTAPATPNSYQVLTTLSGTYYVTATVGSSPNPAKEFVSLTAAVNAYNTNGLAGAVTFVLLDASYSTAETFPLVLNANIDASATNTLTIKPGAGASPVVSGSVASGAVLKLNGADYVIIDGSNAGTTSQNLTITNTSATGTGNAVLWLAAASATDGATNNVVKNTIVTGNSSTGFPQFTVFVGGGGVGVTAPTTSTPAANSSNTLQNNLITKGFYGVFVFGVSATVLDQNNQLIGNQIGQSASGSGFGVEGVRAIYQQNLLVQANEIQNVVDATTASHYGLRLANTVGAVVTRNSVHNVQSNSTTSGNVGYGISLSNTTNNTSASASSNTVSNNLVYNIAAPLASTSSNPNVLGIANTGGYGDRILFNTILLNAPQTAGTGYSAAISNGDSQFATASSALDVRNNIIAITANVTTAAKYFGFYTSAANVTGSTLDYNDYYLAGSGSATFFVGNLNGTSLNSSATLAAWQTATGQEANSKSVDPQFAQTTTVPFNLTPASVTLNSAGTPISGITTDYAGVTRSNPPDIGAIEFTPPACQAVTALAFGSITSTSASITFTAPTGGAGANSYTVTYTPAGGTATTVTPNPTASPVALTGLTPSTNYTVTVTTNCTGATSPSATGTFRTACAPPTYATLPATEGFENTWLSRCDTR
ncbi:beta strand repeat-containing protein, partial [Hymenobacter agri]